MTGWNRVNLVLAVVAAALLVLDRWPAADAGGSPLTGLRTDAVSALRVERGERLTLAFERDASGWRLLYPEAAPARAQRVAQLLAIARAPVRHHFPAGEDLAPYGLAEPSAVLQLDEVRLAFGDRDPTRNGRYVRVDDGEIRVVDDLYFDLTSLPARHFTGD